jgi:type III secretion protein L
MRTEKIIRRDELALWKTAQQILADARNESAAILQRAELEAEAERQRGYQEGLQAARQQQTAILHDTHLRRDAYLAGSEEALVGVVMNAVRKIFSDFSDDERIRIVVGKALTSLRNQSRAVVRVHPFHYEALRGRIDHLKAGSPGLSVLTIEPDTRMIEGLCTLTSDVGVIETDLESQLSALQESFLKAVKAVEVTEPEAEQAGPGQ